MKCKQVCLKNDFIMFAIKITFAVKNECSVSIFRMTQIKVTFKKVHCCFICACALDITLIFLEALPRKYIRKMVN